MQIVSLRYDFSLLIFFYFLKIISSRDYFSFHLFYLTNTIFHFQFISFFLFGQKYDRFEFIFLPIIKELFFKILVRLSKIWPIPLFYLCHFSRGKFDNIKRAIEQTENYYIFKVS